MQTLGALHTVAVCRNRMLLNRERTVHCVAEHENAI